MVENKMTNDFINSNLEQINELDLEKFINIFSNIVEHSSWVAKEAYLSLPFESEDHLLSTFRRAVLAADETVWIEILNLHPELSGKEAQERSLTDYSATEQARLGLNNLEKDEFIKLQEFNKLYKNKFKFPFVACLGLFASREELFSAMDKRMNGSEKGELRAAINEVVSIAELRLKDVLKKGWSL